MYTPKSFAVSDDSLVHDIIKRYNFATLISVHEGSPTISHLPFLFEPGQGKHGLLSAHMARANSQWRSFRTNTEVVVIFKGPHAYISPRWYQPQPDNVPTWNYAVVHAYGQARVTLDEEAAFAVIQRLVTQHDPEWPLELLPEKYRREMMREIVVFEIEVTRLEAKFKLSQNRPDADSKHVSDELLRSHDQVERETGDLMKR